MLHRFHKGGWILDNRCRWGQQPKFRIVKQPGPLWAHPDERGKPGGVNGVDSCYSFRFIGLRSAEGAIDSDCFWFRAVDAFRKDRTHFYFDPDLGLCHKMMGWRDDVIYDSEIGDKRSH